MNLFDILGPVMVGPSSSHTAGAVRIGYVARHLLKDEPCKVKIGLYGSFAQTGKGHGTDRALIAGILDMHPDDMRIPESFELAKAAGIEFEFYNADIRNAHPNTALIEMVGKNDRKLSVQASSAEKPTLIVHNIDQPGHVAEVTSMLSHKCVNIATMQLFRDKRGGYAVMVLETDQQIPEESIKWLEHLEGVIKVTYVNIME